MTKKADTDAMDALHAAVAEYLSKTIKTGNPTGADISNAIRFLKDNGIEADISASKPLQSLAHEFPTFPDEEGEEGALPN